MAIDFSQVKTVTIPEGPVYKIADSNGNTLWQGVGWHTVWKGSQKIGYGGYDENYNESEVLLFATEPYSDTLKIRVSFSELYYWRPGGDEGSGNYVPTDKKSPVTYESFSETSTSLVLAYSRNESRNAYHSSYLRYNKDNGKIFGTTLLKGNEEYARSYIVINKIEVYS